MPTVSEHQKQRAHNMVFSQVFDQALYADWAVTTRFYGAVHLMRAWLQTQGVAARDLTTHEKVDKQMQRIQVNQEIVELYREIKSLSRDARYECFKPSALITDVADAQRIYDDLEALLMPAIQAHLAPSPQPAPSSDP